jgi:hypothetical protein
MTMLHWISENQEWIALAGGIILVTVLVGIVARLTTRTKVSVAAEPESRPVQPLAPPPEPRITPTSLKRPEQAIALPSQPRSDLAVLALQNPRPKLQEVLSKVRRAPATQRDDLIDSFLGYPVTCSGEIKSAVKLKTGKLLIDLLDEDTTEDVFLEVHPGIYPAIDLTRAGSHITANGRFRVSASVVWLDDPEIASPASR